VKRHTKLPPPGIEARAFGQVSAAWLNAKGREYLTRPEREAIVFWLKRHTWLEVLAAIEKAPAPLTLSGVNAILEQPDISPQRTQSAKRNP